MYRPLSPRFRIIRRKAFSSYGPHQKTRCSFLREAQASTSTHIVHESGLKAKNNLLLISERVGDLCVCPTQENFSGICTVSSMRWPSRVLLAGWSGGGACAEGFDLSGCQRRYSAGRDGLPSRAPYVHLPPRPAFLRNLSDSQTSGCRPPWSWFAGYLFSQ